jgi:polysaccharide biosynthesis transport protein
MAATGFPSTITGTINASPGSGYVPISRRQLDIEDYIDVARRHTAWIMGPMLAGTVLATVIAYIMPNVYVSSAEMQITPTQISENIVQTTINQRLTERIMQMQNEILSRTSLSNVIQDPRLDLYKSDRASKPLEDVIEQMKNRDIKIRVDSLPGDRRAAAFSISFTYPDRMKAQATVQALITRFSDLNITTQSRQQTIVNTFVHDELTESKAKLDQLNEQLTKFRVENSGKLPEESDLNIAQMTALQQKATNINDSLNRLSQERVQLDTNLQTLEDRLQLFEMFQKEAGAAGPAPMAAAPVARQQNEQLVLLNRQIDTAETNLAQLHRYYKSTYPDVRNAETDLQTLKSKREDLLKKQDEERQKEQAAQAAEAAKQTPAVAAKKQMNFADAQTLLSLQASITNAKANIKQKEMEAATLEKGRVGTEKEIDDYQGRLRATSSIEATYAEMMANKNAASTEYQRLQLQQQVAEQNNELLQRKAGENLDVLDPPSLPVQPSKPNRLMIIGAGTAISFILGLALAGVQEAKDTSLKNLKDVRAYTNLPVLSSIPLLENTMVVRRKRRIAYLAWSAAVIVGMLAVSAALYYHATQTV